MADIGTTNITGSLAGRYATALYAAAADAWTLDQTVSEMGRLGQLIDQSPAFRQLLESPLYDVQQSLRAALAVLQEQGFSKTVHDFVGVVASNRRLKSLREMVAVFDALAAEKRGQITAQVATAHGLSDVQREQLRARLIESGYGNVNLVEQIDPTLLGGLVLRIGARLYDTSLKSRLQRLQYAMKGAA